MTADIFTADLEAAGTLTAPPRVDRVAIVDTETSSVDPVTGALLEVACVLYSVALAEVVRVQSWIVEASTNEAIDVNGIPVPLLQSGQPRADVMAALSEFAATAEAFVAHNAAFDRAWMSPEIQALPWICTVEDVDWPKRSESRGLIVLAVSHGVPVVSAHRALDDTLTLARLLRRCHDLGHDVGAMLARGLRPKAMYRALVSYDDREMAKAAGFRWDGKLWKRSMAIEDVAGLPFKVAEVRS